MIIFPIFWSAVGHYLLSGQTNSLTPILFRNIAA